MNRILTIHLQPRKSVRKKLFYAESVNFLLKILFFFWQDGERDGTGSEASTAHDHQARKQK